MLSLCLDLYFPLHLLPSQHRSCLLEAADISHIHVPQRLQRLPCDVRSTSGAAVQCDVVVFRRAGDEGRQGRDGLIFDVYCGWMNVIGEGAGSELGRGPDVDEVVLGWRHHGEGSSTSACVEGQMRISMEG